MTTSNPAAESVPAPPSRPGGRAVWAVLILAPLASVALSALLVLSILHFLAQVPTSAVANGLVGDPRLLRDVVEPFTQKGTVAVKRFSDVVYYPVPYATPPHLTLTSRSADRSYMIARQDEFGFVWMIDVGLKDVRDLAGALQGGKDLKDLAGALAKGNDKALPKLQPGDGFTWEARGVRPFTAPATVPAFRQTGTFTILPGGPTEQTEHFPHPYATPPNVTFTGPPLPDWQQPKIKILWTTPLGFRWEAVNPTNPSQTVKVTWTARGIRPTPEQLADLARNQPRFTETVVDTGKFRYAEGEQGEVGFTRPFAFPPNVDAGFVVVTEVTATGFKWKHPNPKRAVTLEQVWTARGVPRAAGSKQTKKK